MPRKFVLSWQPGSTGRTGRWRKKYRGQVHYFAGGRGKTDRDAYLAAVGEWERLKIRLDAAAPKPYQAEYEQAIQGWDAALTWSRKHGDDRMASLAISKIGTLRHALSAFQPLPPPAEDLFESQFDLAVRFPQRKADFEEIGRALDKANKTENALVGPTMTLRPECGLGAPSELEIERLIWRDRLEIQHRSAIVPEKTLSAHIESFLAAKQAGVIAGALTTGRNYILRLHLTHFRDWRGGQTPVVEVDGKVLSDYHVELLKRVETGEWSRTTAKDRLVSLKSFVRWLWQIEAIPTLPRNIDGNALRISTPLPSIVVFTKAEVSDLLEGASKRTKLYLLLMLNCGMTQKDIADLQVSEVDWKNGRISRKRSKTRKFSSVPEVSYRLWTETFRLLKAERTKAQSGPVLLNENGGPLWYEEATSDGRIKKADNVRNAYNRLAQKVGISKSLKSFRKTSADLIRGNGHYASVAGIFLGHAPTQISERHYTRPPQELLDDAIKWLEREYGLKK